MQFLGAWCLTDNYHKERNMEYPTPTHTYNGEPCMRYQLFTRTTSEVHLKAGATWHLHFSAATQADILELATEIDLELDSIKIIDADALT